MTRTTRTTLCFLPLLAFACLAMLESYLLERSLLNTKDMTFVGNQTGSLTEHLLNVWHWDAVVFGLLLLSVPSAMVGVVLLTRQVLVLTGFLEPGK